MSLFSDYDPQPAERPAPVAPRVRLAVPGDTAAIARLVVAREGRDPDETEARIRAELLARTTAGENLVFVAEVEGVVAGFGRARRVEPASDAPPNSVPPGWYLLGVIVDPAWRRRGVGAALTRARIERVARRAARVFYFVSARNRASIALHTALGFREVRRDIHFPNVTFTGGVGVLYELNLTSNRCEP